tara:strand:- start:1875 stop:2042 length:168 start_codon:yes stop_codon:yes gene_type:complete
MRKSKTNEVAEGCMTFIQALTNDHHANKIDVLKEISNRCRAIVNREEASDQFRNR